MVSDHMGVHKNQKGPHGSAFFEAKSNRIRVHSDVLPFALFLFGVHSRLVLITIKSALRSGPPYICPFFDAHYGPIFGHFGRSSRMFE